MKIDKTKFFVTCGYLGLSKFAPGTVASFFTAMLAYLIVKFSAIWLFILILLLFLSTIFGFIETNFYLKNTGRSDPKEVVIDEFAGQLTTIIPSLVLIGNHSNYFVEKIILLSFVSFRLFDITKIFPVSYFDNIDNAFGVMMDDIVAGIMGFFLVALTMQILN